MGKQLGYRALQTRLTSIRRPTGLSPCSHGWHHALMDGPWFVGDQYLHVQAWEADFHPNVAEVTHTAVWICLEQLPIEYYYLEFLKHVDVLLIEQVSAES
ncbi:hypothetical protein CFP56_020526 [Quercus suber]|uniref:DUF4283 domain-containing protein n=1 Tax=Quercus suber TaxID=58331 RepID=A0AAW0KF95_QUESU